MKISVRNKLGEARGAALCEYACLLSLIAVVAVPALHTLGGKTQDVMYRAGGVIGGGTVTSNGDKWAARDDENGGGGKPGSSTGGTSGGSGGSGGGNPGGDEELPS